MSVHRSDKNKIFRTASLGLLAGCLWFSTETPSLAQGNSSSAQPAAQQKARTDADIQSDVGYALTHDSTLKGQQITSTAANGIVTLSGTVQTNAQFQQAETVAGNVPGVSGIVNHIKVANPNSPEPANTEQATQDSLAPAAQANVPPPPPDRGAEIRSPLPTQTRSSDVQPERVSLPTTARGLPTSRSRADTIPHSRATTHRLPAAR